PLSAHTVTRHQYRVLGERVRGRGQSMEDRSASPESHRILENIGSAATSARAHCCFLPEASSTVQERDGFPRAKPRGLVIRLVFILAIYKMTPPYVTAFAKQAGGSRRDHTFII